MKEITIDGVVYVPKAGAGEGAYVIARTYSAGVFAGYVVRRDGKEIELRDARRLWRWSGAASLSELSQKGVKNPNECKFPCTVPTVVLTELVELLPVSTAAKKSIEEVPVWSAQ